MGKVDTTKWGIFRISDYFITVKKGNRLQVPTGANVVARDLVENGAIPRITVTGVNNGIFGYFDYCGNKLSEYRIFNNFISVSFLGTVFYQEGDASLDMKVHCLKPIDVILNKYTGLFLVGAIKASLRESSYADQISSTILPYMEIRLPQNEIGEPDWNYMEEYMRKLELTIDDILSNLQLVKSLQNYKIDIRKWKLFRLGGEDGLFEIVKGTRLTKANQIEGDINFISASSFNNGIAAHISNDEHIHPGNTMTVSYNGSDIGRTFYQEEPFWASDDVNVFYPRFNLNKNIALFLAPIIKAVGGNHVYKNKWLQDDMKLSEIMLPSKTDGSPDWDYMEQYMKKMEKEVFQTINNLENL